MSVIFICYPPGAGGEFLCATLQKHKNCYKGNYVTKKTGKISFDDNITSFFHFNHVSQKNLDPLDVLNKLKTYVEDKTNYIFPIHNTENNLEIISFLRKNIDFKLVSIYSNKPKYQKLINLEAIRKIYLSNDTINTFLIKTIHKQIHLDSITIKKLFAKELNFIDIMLIKEKKELTNSNRLEFCKNILNRIHPDAISDSDYLINWQDLYYNLSTVPDVYKKIVQVLNFEYDENILLEIIERNTKNKAQLDSYNYEHEIELFYANIFS